MLHLDPKDMSVRDAHLLLLGGVAPRPIALVSTVSDDGVVNLSPFSFFNAFGANPPTVAFSPSTRGRDGTRKDTYYNLTATKECVIQAVTYDIVQQISLASTEYPPEVDEFVKSGLTPEASEMVKPPRVKESPFQMECILKEMVSLGEGPGSGNLAICQVVKFHVAEDLFVGGVIDPDHIDLVGRNSANWYTRASGSAMFEVPKPVDRQGIGFDGLPEHIRKSTILTGNNLAQLANSEEIPAAEAIGESIGQLQAARLHETTIEAFHRSERLGDIETMLRIVLARDDMDADERERLSHRTARSALDQGDVWLGWCALLSIRRD
ncbi:flavin reductase family protein [candidate division GN15 bacterium]|nr:flavin reductase family protein [candidate division GN15 bacterium]